MMNERGTSANGGGSDESVQELREEVASLKRDVDYIRSTMKDMHQEVGSAVLLLSRFIGVHWDPGEAVRVAEERTASASGAVDRLANNVGTLEQRLYVARMESSGGGSNEGNGRTSTTTGRGELDGDARNAGATETENRCRHREENGQRDHPSTPRSQKAPVRDAVTRMGMNQGKSFGRDYRSQTIAGAGHDVNFPARHVVPEDSTAPTNIVSKAHAASMPVVSEAHQSVGVSSGRTVGEASDALRRSKQLLHRQTSSAEQASVGSGTAEVAALDNVAEGEERAAGNSGAEGGGAEEMATSLSPRKPTETRSDGSSSRGDGDSSVSWASMSDDSDTFRSMSSIGTANG